MSTQDALLLSALYEALKRVNERVAWIICPPDTTPDDEVELCLTWGEIHALRAVLARAEREAQP